MKTKPLLLLITLLLAFLHGMAQHPCIQKITQADGFPFEGRVLAMFRDSKGFIWFGGNGGLARYDGSTYKTFTTNDGLWSTAIFGIDEDICGRIWFQNTINHKFDYYYKGKFYNPLNTPWLDSLWEYSFKSCDSDSNVYFADYNCTDEFYILDNKCRLKKYQISNLIDSCIILLKKCKDGSYLLEIDSGLYIAKTLAESPKLVRRFHKISGVYDDFHDKWYVRSFSQEMRKWLIIKFSEFTAIDTLEVPEEIDFKGKNFVLEDSRGIYWIGSSTSGVFCIKDNRIIRSLRVFGTRHILEDNENNIWIAASDGIYRIRPCFFNYNHYDPDNYNYEKILSISSNKKDPNDGIWFTTGKHQFLLRQGKFLPLNLFAGKYSFNEIFSLANGTIVVSDFNVSNLYFPFKITSVEKNKIAYQGLYSKPEKGIIMDWISKGNLVLCIDPAYPYITIHDVTNQFKIIDTIDPHRYSNVYFNYNDDIVIYGKENFLWKNKKLVPYDRFKFIGAKGFICNTNPGFGDLIYFGNDSVYLMNEEHLLNFGACFDYPIKFTRNNGYVPPYFYFRSNEFIYVCKNPLDAYKKHKVNIQLLDLNFRNISSAFPRNDSLYVASDAGITVIPWSSVSSISAKPPIAYFRSVRLNDNEIEWPQNYVKVRGKNKIRLDFGSINYSSSPVIYSYMLDGEDTSWTEGSDNVVILQSLAPGDYKFKVRTRKLTSPWSEVVECRIIILPTFWQHPLFYIGLFLLFGAIVAWVIIRRKNVQLRRKDLDHQLVLLEQKALQSMMNPHFIFNALGSIQNYLMQNKSDEAGIYLSQFARLIRQNLSAINTGFINLGEEVERLKNYLDLEQMRLKRKFEYKIMVDESLDEDALLIPSMIIQPIVENSIWHGISGMESKGEVDLSFSRESDATLRITVEDNGVGIRNGQPPKSSGEQQLHLGAELTRKRLEMLGKKMGIHTSLEYSLKSPGSPNPGTRVVMMVPVTHND